MEEAIEVIENAIEVLDSKELLAVCHNAQIHHCPYNGPIFDMEKAKKVLGELKDGR